ncbi:MAG: TIGR03960 family B12-binding radical SAM protein [Acutalibacteraceae bacterium]|nr:TIGR03960 family B12-binding radical SAM protein [Acutalibacteraceae bacterium]
MDARLEKILPLVQKPGRYIGGDLNSVEKDPSTVDMRFAFCFPDTYEIGMSHLGIKILYYLINEREDAYCERVFAPWLDMEEQMRKVGLPLFTLETGTPLSEFDLIGFTLQYEMSFTTCLYMLELGGVPLLAKDRHGLENLVVGGGPCACNPEPIADFFDLFMLGDGEEVMMDLLDLYKEYKGQGASREEFLKAASHIGGIYVPSLYDVSYNEDGTVKAVSPVGDAPAVVRKRVVADLDSAYYPDKFLVPYIDIVHDRAVEEIYRGCIRGCRFCQAGFLYRPIREKSVDTINAQAKSLCESTGYDEISVISLSTSDYSGIQPLLSDMADWTAEQKINISLPSLRIDTFSDELVEKLNLIRRSGLTFAPEAGSQRMRDVINKNITEEDIMKSVRIAFANNYATVKLYFMLGLPYETMEDVEAIVDLGKQIVDAFYQNPDRVKGRHLTVNISASPFVPKPYTPFQWEPQDTKASIEEKQERLHELAAKTRLHISSHHSDTIFLEAAFARGDRRLCKVIRKAFEKGCYFDSWDNCFDIDKWMEAFEECGLDPAFYSNRRRSYDEVLPWDHLDNGPSKEFLIRENEKAKEAAVTPNCREQCSNCGAQRLNDGKCDALLKIDRGREAV